MLLDLLFLVLNPPSPSGSCGVVNLTWNTIYGYTYAVYRGRTPGGEGPSPIVSGLTTGAYTDTGLISHVVYYYKVVGTNPCGDDTTSNEAFAEAGCTMPLPPAWFTVAGPVGGVVSLAWGEVSGATYAIYRLDPGAEAFSELVSGLTDTTYEDSDYPTVGVFTYIVFAVNCCGVAMTQQVSVTIDCCTSYDAGPACDTTYTAGPECDTSWTQGADCDTTWTREGCN